MVEAKSLCMNYGTTRALIDASFIAADNQVMGLLGPNGAGKTTCMKIITTQMVPTAGTAIVCGIDVLENPIAVRRKVGYLPETAPLYADMEVAEYLEFVGRGRGLENGGLKNRIDWVVNACQVKEVYRKPIGDLSRGYRQRVGLAQALIHDPEVLILDEPTSGLDPLQIISIRKLIKDLSASKTIIFSTHILQEVEAISDRIVIIDEGRIIAEGTPDQLRNMASGEPGYFLEMKAPRQEIEQAFAGSESALHFNFVSESDGFARYYITAPEPDRLWSESAEFIRRKGWLVREFAPSRPSLEQAFIQLTREKKAK